LYRAKLVRLLIAASICALVFFAALSSDVSVLTSSNTLSHPVIDRKLYSILAFAIAGIAMSTVLRRRYLVLKASVAIAILSAGIELAQRATGSHEGLRWNLIDVACGALGGAVGGAAYILILKLRQLRDAPSSDP